MMDWNHLKATIRRMSIPLLLAVFASPSSSQDKPTSGEETFFTPSKDLDGLSVDDEAAANLPNVLLIGDSISIGYTRPVATRLKDIANVQRVKANCGDTKSGLRNLKTTWLGDTEWDVIHFNWGLHDLCYRHPDSKVQGKRDKVNGSQSVPLEQYEKNLEALVLQLKETKATLIWASTTVVPEGEAGRVVGDDLKYNKAAANVMKRHGIAIDDLHAVSAGFKGQYSRPGNVHFDKEGSAKLAEQVAASIRRSLPEIPQEALPALKDGAAIQNLEDLGDETEWIHRKGHPRGQFKLAAPPIHARGLPRTGPRSQVRRDENHGVGSGRKTAARRRTRVS